MRLFILKVSIVLSVFSEAQAGYGQLCLYAVSPLHLMEKISNNLDVRSTIAVHKEMRKRLASKKIEDSNGLSAKEHEIMMVQTKQIPGGSPADQIARFEAVMQTYLTRMTPEDFVEIFKIITATPPWIRRASAVSSLTGADYEGVIHIALSAAVYAKYVELSSAHVEQMVSYLFNSHGDGILLHVSKFDSNPLAFETWKGTKLRTVQDVDVEIAELREKLSWLK